MLIDYFGGEGFSLEVIFNLVYFEISNIWVWTHGPPVGSTRGEVGTGWVCRFGQDPVTPQFSEVPQSSPATCFLCLTAASSGVPAVEWNSGKSRHEALGGNDETVTRGKPEFIYHLMEVSFLAFIGIGFLNLIHFKKGK